MLTSSRHKSISKKQVFHSGGPVERCGVVVIDLEVQEVRDVVVQVAAHGRQVVHQLDSGAGEDLRVADAAQLQDLWRGYCAGTVE